MPFGSQKKKDVSSVVVTRHVFENALKEYALHNFLSEYRDLVEKYDLLLMTTAVPFQLVVKTMNSVIESHKNGNDRRNYHKPIAPETKEGVLNEILDISFKME